MQILPHVQSFHFVVMERKLPWSVPLCRWSIRKKYRGSLLRAAETIVDGIERSSAHRSFCVFVHGFEEFSTFGVMFGVCGGVSLVGAESIMASTSVRPNHSTSLLQRESRTCFALFALWKWPGWRVRNIGRRGLATEWQSRSTFAIPFAFKDPLHSTEPRGFSQPSRRTPTCPSFHGFRWGVASRSHAIVSMVEFLLVLATDPSRRNSPGGHVHPSSLRNRATDLPLFP